jgi:hypothetical protein
MTTRPPQVRAAPAVIVPDEFECEDDTDGSTLRWTTAVSAFSGVLASGVAGLSLAPRDRLWDGPNRVPRVSAQAS